jgi:excisionase family DNA binding protein
MILSRGSDPVTGATLGPPSAPWRSGYAAACKAVYSGSNPDGASPKPSPMRGFDVVGGTAAPKRASTAPPILRGTPNGSPGQRRPATPVRRTPCHAVSNNYIDRSANKSRHVSRRPAPQGEGGPTAPHRRRRFLVEVKVPPIPQLLTPQQTADALGVSTATLERLANDGRLRRVKVRGATRYSATDLATYVCVASPRPPRDRHACADRRAL